MMLTFLVDTLMLNPLCYQHGLNCDIGFVMLRPQG
jgi:hypothetical protein